MPHSYFAAESDEQAAAAAKGGPDPASHDVVDLPGLDPVIALNALSGLLIELGGLARRALAGGNRLYAWVSL